MVNVYDHSLLWRSLVDKTTSAGSLNVFFFLCAVDIAIGSYVSTILPSSDAVFDEFWSSVDYLIGNLNMVITWITENPAGLKLNEPVNSTLSSFFRYHIHLWKTFIHFIRDPAIIEAILMIPCVGLSLFAAILGDFLQIFTLHIRCFDAYASRLLSVTWNALRSLWGLVRGKKWNPLRQRTDNIILDPSEMFIGTIFYLILLFLLPTILVYFTVFRLLRLIVSAFLQLLRFISQYPVQTFKLIGSE